jgi:hypothetical protein
MKKELYINDCLVVQNRSLYIGIISPCLVYSSVILIALWALTSLIDVYYGESL